MASSVIPLNTIPKDNATVVADGVKTLSELIAELYNKINWDRMNYCTPIILLGAGTFRINEVDNGAITFTRTVPTSTTVYIEGIVMSRSAANSKYYTWRLTTSGNTLINNSDVVLANGKKIILYYLS